MNLLPVPKPEFKDPLVEALSDNIDPSSITRLPDGSGFFTASFPLPKDHWLYAPSCEGWDNERDCSPDTPLPLLSNNQREAVEVALKWAIRGATMNGKERDFDPDALMLNAAYAMCGPGIPTIEPAPQQEPLANQQAGQSACNGTDTSGEKGITPAVCAAPLPDDVKALVERMSLAGLMTLESAVRTVVDKHGGIRAAARATGVDKAFISRLLRGHKTAPSEETLVKLGLRPVPLYVVTESETIEAMTRANAAAYHGGEDDGL